jgi:hypothetical protein
MRNGCVGIGEADEPAAVVRDGIVEVIEQAAVVVLLDGSGLAAIAEHAVLDERGGAVGFPAEDEAT